MRRMNLQSNRIEKQTPVWRNKVDGRVACGNTIYEALNVGIRTTQDLSAWEQVDTLPREERLVIRQGKLLTRNPIVEHIASCVVEPGHITTKFGGREQRYEILYCDSCKIIIN